MNWLTETAAGPRCLSPSEARLRNLSATDCRRDESRVGSGFGKKIENWVGRDLAYPTNVLHLATECGNRNHSAAFPRALPDWFIRLFTETGDVVLDPFMGSGKTVFSALALQRAAIGIDLDPDYVAIATRRIHGDAPLLAKVGT
jgi:DNA modification methylase